MRNRTSHGSLNPADTFFEPENQGANKKVISCNSGEFIGQSTQKQSQNFIQKHNTKIFDINERIN